MKLIESKAVAWISMILVVALIVFSMFLALPWWGFISEFFCFIGVFAHLASLYIRRMSPVAADKLDVCALVALILAVIGFIVEFVVFEL
ncbi:MAG: hypothetical protein K2N88_02500 [Muribaculaceae bacterium]|nr:hypothetical protein [Muribaculaceae bacterium]